MKTDDRKRHCWECLRRSLVCDFTEPQCKRCVANGALCPGYGDKKPLRLNWMEPGRVKSKTRKSKKAEQRPQQKGLSPSPASTSSTSSVSSSTSIPSSSLPKQKPNNSHELSIAPSPFKTNEDACLDAIGYYNSAMHPILSRSRLRDHPGVYKIQPAHIKAGIARPDFVRLDIVCVALNHRMNSSQDEVLRQALAPTYYHFRGLILRSLHEAMSVEYSRKENISVLIAGILSLLLADAHQGASPHWRLHLQGIQELIALRGGLRAMSGPGVEPLLLCYAYVTVVGDTSTPASELIMNTSLLAELDKILDVHGHKLYSFYPFPTPLFAAVVKINYLRAHAAIRLPDTTHNEDLTSEAEDVLTRIASFDAETWSHSRHSGKEDEIDSWTLLARLMQAAVTIYCISSLQSISILPDSSALLLCRSANRKLLHALLLKALEAHYFGGSLLWPLVVLGIDAGCDTMDMRAFIRNSLGRSVQNQGSYVPLMARGILERYWTSGKTTWDECFDRPYALATQWTVNRRDLP
ncbi:Zn(II)2Cys6 transcription factor [Aspergillus undulatus]|uniref:Zn(II)2Cys6 transcription factor n=1 Tax=Aspergillus undulatus TaxID=1810928 RepID=UPI003CCD121C